MAILEIGISSVLGVLSGLGIGGGSLLLLWLTVLAGFSVPEARSINLLFFLPSALICSLFRIKQNRLHPKALLPAMIPGCIASGICAWLSSSIDHQTIRILFSVLLIIAGSRELFYRK